MAREYNGEDVTDESFFGDLFTIEEWNEAIETGWITNWDGSGYWVKDGKESDDEVFSTPQEDATHIAWYNK